MDLLLDFKTICITLIVGHLFSVILISAYWRQHEKNPVLKFFFFAKCLQVLSWYFIMFRGEIPDVFTISLANTLLFVGASLEAIALLKLRGVFYKTTQKIYVFLTIFNIVGFHSIFFILHNDENIRLAFASLTTAILFIMPAYRFISGKMSSLIMRIMGYVYFLVIITLVVRGGAALLSHQIMGLFTPGIIQSFSFLAIYIVMILGNTGFILLLKEDTDKELVRIASYDDLTQTLNRRTFISRGKQCINDCAKEKKPISLLLLDIDHFKKINDSNGHVVGDQVLIDLSARINKLLGPKDLFGRYGGDEFAILLPGVDETHSTEFAEQIRMKIEEADIAGILLYYTLSLGVLTVIPDEHTELERLYIVCDKAQYFAKQNGRNCVYRIQYENTEAAI